MYECVSTYVGMSVYMHICVYTLHAYPIWIEILNKKLIDIDLQIT